MTTDALIRVTNDSTSGDLRLQPVDKDGNLTSQYIPELLAKPDQITYVFTDPKSLHQLIRNLSVVSSSGIATATQSLAAMHKIRLQINNRGSDKRSHEEGIADEKVMEDWRNIVQTLPRGHRVKEVQLDFGSSNTSEEDFTSIVQPMEKALSKQAGSKVEVFCG